jgi:hypothetical protein
MDPIDTAPPAESVLLLGPQDCVFGGFRDAELNDRLGRNFDFRAGLWVDADTRLPFLLYQLPKPGQREFAFLFDPLVSEVGERIEEKRGRSFVRLGCFGESVLKFSFGHGWRVL